MINDILKGRYVVIEHNKLRYIIDILENMFYDKKYTKAIEKYPKQKYVIESENGELLLFSYDFYMENIYDKIEFDLIKFLREEKLKRILK